MERLDIPSDRGFSRTDCPFYDQVPKDMVANLEFRAYIINECRTDERAAAEITMACKREPLFWLNTFGWTYDPRLPVEQRRHIPFLTFDVQDEALYEIFRALGYYNICVRKSRDMGATWLGLASFVHCFEFQRDTELSVASRKADYVDGRGDKDTLFWKIQYLLDRQPDFLPCRYEKTSMNITNANGSQIKGEQGSETGRGGRAFAVFVDEFASFTREDGYEAIASLQSNANSVIYNSTPKGTGNAYYDVHQMDSSKKVSMPWYEDPRKNKGLYQGNKETGEIFYFAKTPAGRVLPKFLFPHDYDFICDGKIRSPWYDYQCTRYPHQRLVAQELDMDFQSSTFRFFEPQVLQRIIEHDTSEPVVIGDFEFDPTTLEFVQFREDENGPWCLWCHLDEQGKPVATKKYAAGVDISSGTGASNSCIAIGDINTGEKIAEYANPRIPPEQFGDVACAAAYWFGEAYMIWENNGPGRAFGARVIQNRYLNFYHRRDDTKITHKVSDVAGWPATVDTIYQLLSEYRQAQFDGSFTNPSKIAVQECYEYVSLPGNKVAHEKSVSTDDPSGAAASHGDRCRADALLWKAMQEKRSSNFDSEEDEITREAPEHSFAGRRRRYLEEQRRKNTDEWALSTEVW